MLSFASIVVFELASYLVLLELGLQFAQMFRHTALLIFKLTLSFASVVVVELGLLSALLLFHTVMLIFTLTWSFSYLVLLELGLHFEQLFCHTALLLFVLTLSFASVVVVELGSQLALYELGLQFAQLPKLLRRSSLRLFFYLIRRRAVLAKELAHSS